MEVAAVLVVMAARVVMEAKVVVAGVEQVLVDQESPLTDMLVELQTLVVAVVPGIILHLVLLRVVLELLLLDTQ